jgi:hypothetical protein
MITIGFLLLLGSFWISKEDVCFKLGASAFAFIIIGWLFALTDLF